MKYETPEIVDFGSLTDMTAASGVVGDEDGIGKTVQGQVGPVGVSVGVLP